MGIYLERIRSRATSFLCIYLNIRVGEWDYFFLRIASPLYNMSYL